jgi:hypothetical protein
MSRPGLERFERIEKYLMRLSDSSRAHSKIEQNDF